MKPVTDPNLLEQLNAGNQGLKPVSNPELLAQLNGDAQPEKTKMEKFKEFFTGNDEFDVPDTASYFRKQQAKKMKFNPENPQQFFDNHRIDKMFEQTGVAVFGNDEDTKNHLLKTNPSLKFSLDKNGNEYFTDEDGDKFVLNKGGFDATQTAKTVGQGLTYIGGGMATAPIKSLGKRVLATGAIESGINAGNQRMGGRDNLDYGEVALSGASGALFQSLTPMISKLWRGIKNSNATNSQAGEVLSRKLGLELSPQQKLELGSYARNLDDTIDEKTLASHVELNQKPTRGTLTGDQRILQDEKMLRSRGSEKTKEYFQSVDDRNRVGLKETFDNMQKNPSDDFYQTSEKMLSKVVDQESLAKEGVNQAYEGVKKAYIGTEPFRAAPQRIKQSLSKNNVLLAPSTTKRANDVLADINNSLDTLGDAKAVSWQAVDAQRKRINSAFAGAKKSDERALKIIKNEYDNIVDDAFEKNLFSGDIDSIKNLKNARKIATDYFSKFTDKGDFNEGKIIDKWLKDGATPEMVSNAIFNQSGSLKQNTAPLVKRYLSIVGKESEGHELMKELAIKRLFADRSPESLRTSLSNSLTGNKTFMNEVFTPKELGFLSRTLHHFERLEPPKGSVQAKSSGTAERIFDWVSRPVNQSMPLQGLQSIIKRIVSALDGTERSLTALPYKQLNLSGASGVASQQGGNYSSSQ
jgi:hypothetical protein